LQEAFVATIAIESGIRPSSSRLVAPRWHTALLAGLFLALALSGALFQKQTHEQPARLAPLYFSLIAMEWGLFLYVWKGGLRRTGTKLRELIGGTWRSPADVAVDMGLAAGLWIAWTIVDKGIDRWFPPSHAVSIQTLLPRHGIDILLWIGVSVSAGICEELVFRGYFQKQFEAFTGSRWIALSMQAALFGIAHGYQGMEACCRIAAYGAMFGLLALWRGSLRPGMIAHSGTDILSGIFGI
jgi:membrane protease YdiL (CAAX protease family)